MYRELDDLVPDVRGMYKTFLRLVYIEFYVTAGAVRFVLQFLSQASELSFDIEK